MLILLRMQLNHIVLDFCPQPGSKIETTCSKHLALVRNAAVSQRWTGSSRSARSSRAMYLGLNRGSFAALPVPAWSVQSQWLARCGEAVWLERGMEGKPPDRPGSGNACKSRRVSIRGLHERCNCRSVQTLLFQLPGSTFDNPRVSPRLVFRVITHSYSIILIIL